MKINAINCYNNNYTNNTNFKARFTSKEIEILIKDTMAKKKHEMAAYPRLYTLLEFLDGFKKLEIAELITSSNYYPKTYNNIYYAQISIGDSLRNKTIIGSDQLIGNRPNTYELLYNSCIKTSYEDDAKICRMHQNIFEEQLYKNRGKTREDVLSLARKEVKTI